MVLGYWFYPTTVLDVAAVGSVMLSAGRRSLLIIAFFRLLLFGSTSRILFRTETEVWETGGGSLLPGFLCLSELTRCEPRFLFMISAVLFYSIRISRAEFLDYVYAASLA